MTTTTDQARSHHGPFDPPPDRPRQAGGDKTVTRIGGTDTSSVTPVTA